MYLNTQQIAEKLDKSPYTVHRWVAQDKLPGRKIGGTWIMTEKELRDFQNGKKVRVAPLFDVRSAAEYLDVSVEIVRRLIRNNDLKGTRIDNRGRFGGTLVFTKAALDRLEPALLEHADAGRRVKGSPDKHIAIIDGKYVVKGTKNRFGKPFAYTHLFDARGRARRAYGGPPRYRAGDLVDIGEDELQLAEIIENVTRLCTTALVCPLTVPIDERENILIPVRKIKRRVRSNQ